MIRLQAQPLNTLDDARAGLQTAIELEFSTLPPYLYAKFSILPDSNPQAVDYLGTIVGQEMIHLCLACNILNALGGTPALNSGSGDYPWPPIYPTTLPGDIGPPDGEPIRVGLLPFSEAATAQGMAIELPENPLVFPELLAVRADAETETIGQFYERLDELLGSLPAGDWQVGRRQIRDDQFFPGQLYPVNNYQDAHRAISQIVSEGEGSSDSPLDFQNEVSHYYRFKEMNLNKVLTKTPHPPGYQYGPESFGIDWNAVYPAIPNPSRHDFSKEPPEAQAAQTACNVAYSRMIDALQLAVTGTEGALGIAVRAMFDLRMAALAALRVPLADGHSVAGPSFIYIPNSGGASS